MKRLFPLAIVAVIGCASGSKAGPRLPAAGEVVRDLERGEVLLRGTIRHPKDKPCIDDWGQRVQAFAGCAEAAAGPAKFADYFVFLMDARVEDVYRALTELGARSRVHYSIPEAQKRSGLRPDTKPEDFLQGDPAILSVFWQEEGGAWRERPYEDFALEKISVDGADVVKPWTPHFVVHGSGALRGAGTGCIACLCDCAGGIIADNRYPVYNPKPVLKFDWSQAPPAGTVVYLRIRVIASR